jgi:hypothetical protein
MTDVQLPLWVEYAKALGAPIVALVAALIAGSIAYRQWRTARNKLKLDLFEKRLQVYEAAVEVINLMTRPYAPDREELDKQVAKFVSARWLFGKDVAAHLHGLEQHANLALAAKLHVKSEMTYSTVEFEERKAREEPIARQQMRMLNGVFHDYLALTH